MEYNDYELVAQAQEKNDDAINILHNKYHDLLLSRSKRIYNYLKSTGLELADVMQEATIGFEEAIKAYNQDNNALFYTFALLCVNRQLNSLLIKQGRDKYKILNEAVTIDDDEEGSMHNFLTNDITPETELFNKEEASNLYNKIKLSLTELEDCVFELKIQGYEYKEIANILELNIKEVYNTISRIKTKIKKILNK